ncbi:MAG TPA: hypothetical protein DCS48_05055 [Desulfovibrio sp.]|nr:hypothetical protein [Desulfovibrio sp.]
MILRMPPAALRGPEKLFYCAPSWGLPLRGGAFRHRANQLSCGFVEKVSLDSSKTFIRASPLVMEIGC